MFSRIHYTKWYNLGMALVASKIKAKYKQRIYNGLKREFSQYTSPREGFPPIADEVWMKLADAISDVAIDLVEEIHTNAEVIPGILVDTTGTPAHHTGKTVSPGKID